MQGFVDSESIFDMISIMKTAAIICELNPLHDGHRYIIKKARELTGADFVVAMMSGNFVQRGEPAVFNKYYRTKSALTAGFDAVFELPTIAASARAEFFAKGAVSILEKTGVVDYLCFGSETGELIDLDLVSNSLDKGTVTDAFRNGRTYAAAADQDSLLTGPNDLLGVEYRRALFNLKSGMEPVAIKRTDCPHASDIRNSLNSFAKIQSTVVDKTMALFPDDLTPLLNYSLSSLKTDLAPYFDCTLDLSNRIINEYEMCSYSTFVDKIKSRNYTRARISRTLLHIILGITDDHVEAAFTKDGISYLRLLGMKKSAGEILRQIKDEDSIHVITKPSDYRTISSNAVRKCFELDLHASEIYRQMVYNKYNCDIGSDILSSPIITD